MTDYAQYWTPADEQQAQFSIDVAHSGKAFWAWGEDRANDLAAYMPEHTDIVVDYGCGIGRVLRNMPGDVRIGVDVSAEMLALAREHAPDCLFLETGGRSIPLPDGSADFVYSLLTLQHMDADDVLAIVCETARVLRPGGACYLQFSAFGRTWAPDAELPRGSLHWAGQYAGSWHGAHGALAYTPGIITNLAQTAGLTVREVIVQEAKLGYLNLWGTK